jgi:hypothetical protein
MENLKIILKKFFTKLRPVAFGMVLGILSGSIVSVFAAS